MTSLTIPNLEWKNTTNTYGLLIAEPLERGFAVTLGNSLRRVLLNSLQGAAVTWVKIEGVQHEFTCLPYMKEDIQEFLLNVKAIRIKSLSDKPGKLFLDVKGPGIVYAADIKTSSDFEIVNPELLLATLDDSEAKFSVEFNVELGRGYSQAVQSDGLPVGARAVDAIYTPLVRVKYNTETSRLGYEPGFERLVFELWTDGTIKPQEAVSESARIIIEQFNIFAAITKRVVEVGGQVGRLPVSTERYDMPIEQLGLSGRTLNCLRRNNITKVGEVLEKTDKELLSLKKFGQKSLEELKNKLMELGFVIGMNVQEVVDAPPGINS